MAKKIRGKSHLHSKQSHSGSNPLGIAQRSGFRGIIPRAALPLRVPDAQLQPSGIILLRLLRKPAFARYGR